MKQFAFLFDHFEFFQIVWAVVMLDTIVGVASANIRDVFQWSYLDTWIRKIIKYTGFLIFANVIEYYSALSGFKIEGIGIAVVAGSLILAEGASLKKNLKGVWPGKIKRL
jgi:hypothetical protein